MLKCIYLDSSVSLLLVEFLLHENLQMSWETQWIRQERSQLSIPKAEKKEMLHAKSPNYSPRLEWPALSWLPQNELICHFEI